ncbi:SurA N-terminal domain-containing protein [Paenibacillus humicola]|uniref:SurA N-terminal domain-containing protein n=1 Tax=Paenibacillus humicola TaxID=3110540 RepID=UPI00237C4A85|nr:peptidyl-prolyl cis-trans isomerase [Paenibacillus humicola]
MGKDRVLRTVVILQGLCMIVLAVVVVTRVLAAPAESHASETGGADNGGNEPSRSAGRVAATVGDEQITEEELAAALRSEYGDSVLHTLMVRSAVRQEAAAYGLGVSPEELDSELAEEMEGYGGEQPFYQAMKDQLGLTPEAVREDAKYRLLLEKIATRTISVSDREIDDYIKANKDEFEPKVQYRLAWILSADKQDADAVLDKLGKGEEFALMARTYSTDKDTAANGGELGLIDADDPFVGGGVMKTAAAMSIGEVAGPIAVPGGQAVVKLEEKRSGPAMSVKKQREIARRQVALSKASPTPEVEEELLTKYKAAIMK